MFLRVGLADMAIGLGAFFIAGAAAPLVMGETQPKAMAWVVVACTGSMLYLAAAPVLYRALRLRPMHFPPCPHCAAKEGPWGIPAGSSPVASELLVCGQCARATRFVYTGASAEVAATACPTYVLRWPRPLGLWQRV